MLETDSDEMNDSDTSDTEGGDDDGSSDGGPHDAPDPMQNWEEFDEDAVYQKKRIDPEMRQWILTKDCRRTISDDFFNNPARTKGTYGLLHKQQLTALHLELLLGICCDNCMRKANPTNRFESIYDIIGFLDTSSGRKEISRPIKSEHSDLESSILPKTWGNLRTGTRLVMRREALKAWRYNQWTKDYQLCSWGAIGVMPDHIVSKLASSVKIETMDDLLEAVSDWGYASKYGDDTLSLLKATDDKHRSELQAQREQTRQRNKKRKIEDLERDMELQDFGGLAQPGPSTTPLYLIHSWILEPVLVKYVGRPRPKPRPKSQPILVSRPYTRTDIFDSLMGNSK